MISLDCFQEIVFCVVLNHQSAQRMDIIQEGAEGRLELSCGGDLVGQGAELQQRRPVALTMNISHHLVALGFLQLCIPTRRSVMADLCHRFLNNFPKTTRTLVSTSPKALQFFCLLFAVIKEALRGWLVNELRPPCEAAARHANFSGSARKGGREWGRDGSGTYRAH